MENKYSYKSITLGITGASGSIIAFELLRFILKYYPDIIVNVVVTKDAIITIKHELKWSFSTNPNTNKMLLIEKLNLQENCKLNLYGFMDWFAPIASGTGITDTMVISPCSMTSLAKINYGISDNLLLRAADVTLKEQKPLILVPRETPFSTIHLENMYKLSQKGVLIIPPIPAFYNFPQTIHEVVNFIVGKILGHLGFSHNLFPNWSENKS